MVQQLRKKESGGDHPLQAGLSLTHNASWKNTSPQPRSFYMKLLPSIAIAPAFRSHVRATHLVLARFLLLSLSVSFFPELCIQDSITARLLAFAAASLFSVWPLESLPSTLLLIHCRSPGRLPLKLFRTLRHRALAPPSPFLSLSLASCHNLSSAIHFVPAESKSALNKDRCTHQMESRALLSL